MNIQFKSTYPVLPPKLIMKTAIDHANINSQGKFAIYSLNKINQWHPRETQMHMRDLLKNIVDILKHPVSEMQIFYEKYHNQFADITSEDPSLLDDLDALIKDKMKNGF